MIIVLDGAKGAGKSSVSDILLPHFKNAVQLSLDHERHALAKEGGNRAGLNKEAFENILRRTRTLLKEGRDVIIDSGLTAERVSMLEHLALEPNVTLYMFFLKAPHDLLLERVRLRDRAKGRETDTKRFGETFAITASKEFDGFTLIETDALNAEAVAEVILKTIIEKR